MRLPRTHQLAGTVPLFPAPRQTTILAARRAQLPPQASSVQLFGSHLTRQYGGSGAEVVVVRGGSRGVASGARKAVPEQDHMANFWYPEHLHSAMGYGSGGAVNAIAAKCNCRIDLRTLMNKTTKRQRCKGRRGVRVVGTPANVSKALDLLELHVAQVQLQSPEFTQAAAQEGWRAYQARPARSTDAMRSFVKAPGRLLGARKGRTSGVLKLDFETATEPVLISMAWLRDGCPCNLCYDPSSGRRVIKGDNLRDLDIDYATVLADESLQIAWAQNHEHGRAQHMSKYPLADLTAALGYAESRPPFLRPHRELWDAHRFQKDAESRNISYSAWMAGGQDFARALTDLQRWGLIVLKGVPASDSAVSDIANRIHGLHAAWEEVDNELHHRHNSLLQTDFTSDLNSAHTPRLKLLHCLEIGQPHDVRVFSDGLRAAYDLRCNHNSYWASLTKTTMKHVSGDHYLVNKSLHCIFPSTPPAPQNYPDTILWAPSTHALHWHLPPRLYDYDRRLDLDIALMRDALNAFESSLHNARNTIEIAMGPGDCIIFDNFRIPHGRRQLDAQPPLRSGRFRGSYIDKDNWDMAWRTLTREGVLTDMRPAVSSVSEYARLQYRAEELSARRVLGLEPEVEPKEQLGEQSTWWQRTVKAWTGL